MVSTLEAGPERGGEGEILGRLLGLYAEERRIYDEVLVLSRRQAELIGRGAALADLQRVLRRKRDCLDGIARLERAEGEARRAWEEGRHRWGGEARARLHGALQEIGGLIEEILECEERSDRLLLARAGSL